MKSPNNLFRKIWKYNEFIFLLVGLLMSILYIWNGDRIGSHSFAYEKLGKVIFGIAIFFIVEAVNRFHFIAQYPRLYKYFDSSFKENKEWKASPESHRPWQAIALYSARLIALGLLISAL